MTYDDWKTRSDRDEYPDGRDEPDDNDDWDEPVTCGRCGRVHELQESFFCPPCAVEGWCKRCWTENHSHVGGSDAE